MNRRSFLKSAALAAVAVPVVGFVAIETVPMPDMVWVVKFSKPKHLGHGTGITPDREQAIDWFIEWTNQGYGVTVAYVPQSEARF